MGLPRRVAVGPHVYEVSTDPALVSAAMRETGSALYGHCDIAATTITIDASVASHTMLAETLLHELLHACTSLAGLLVEWDEDRDEQVVARLAPILLDVLRRNPRVVEYLVAS